MDASDPTEGGRRAAREWISDHVEKSEHVEGEPMCTPPDTAVCTPRGGVLAGYRSPNWHSLPKPVRLTNLSVYDSST